MRAFFFIVIAFLQACSNDPYEDYVGFWKKPGDDLRSNSVIEIQKDGDLFLFKENIIDGRPSSFVLAKQESQLYIQDGFGGITLGLSSNTEKLHMANRVYERITTNELETIKAGYQEKQREKELAREKFREENAQRQKEAELTKEENRLRCQAMLKEYQSARKEIFDAFEADRNERSRKIDSLIIEYRKKQKSIPRCWF